MRTTIEQKGLLRAALAGDDVAMLAVADRIEEGVAFPPLMGNAAAWRLLPRWLTAARSAIDSAANRWPLLGIKRSELRRIPAHRRKHVRAVPFVQFRMTNVVRLTFSFQHRYIVVDASLPLPYGLHLDSAHLERRCLNLQPDYLPRRLYGLLVGSLERRAVLAEDYNAT